MSQAIRVLLVCADPQRRARVRDGVADATGPGVTVATAESVGPDAAVDCVVAVPGDRSVAETRRLLERAPAPVVVFGAGDEAAELLASGATDVVCRDGEGGYAVLAGRLRQVAADPMAADGGETAAAGTPPEAIEQPLERITDGFLTLAPDWTVTYLNEAGREMLGETGLVGRSIWETFPGETHLRERLERAMETGEAETFETHDADRSGWFEVRAYPAEDGLSVFFEDVTERKHTREELRASEQSLQRLHEVASDPEGERREKIERMLAVGRERLGVELGFLTHIADGTQEIVEAIGDHPRLQPGSQTPLSEAYCRHTLGRSEPLGVADASAEGWAEDPAYERFGLACYLGATISVDGERYGTVCFAGTEPQETPFTDSERMFVDLLTDWMSYILEQEAYEEQLRENQRRLETITENVPVVVFALDPEGTYTLARGRGLEALGFEPGQAVGESIFDRYSEYPEVLNHVRRALDGEQTHHTVELHEDVTIEVWYQPVFEDGELQQVVGVARDITELATHRERLSGLLETTRSLMQARSREEVADLAAKAARDVLGFPINDVRLYDSAAETLEPAAETTTAKREMGKRPVYDVGEGLPGEVFATGEPRVVEDVTAADPEPDVDDVASAMCYPVGVHGTISVGATEQAAFDETDEQALALLATAAAAACMRAKREREIREAREHVETVLERVNGLIEDTIEVLVQATTREELEAGVVERLAGAAPHSFAWIGRPDVPSETLEPTEWSGNVDVAVEDLRFDLDGDGPVARALAGGTPQVVECRDADLGCVEGETEACIVVPLVYKDTTYGVVTVFAAERAAFDEREPVVLSALGRAVANAINALERGRILDADQVIELEFTVDSPDLLVSRLSRAGGCTVETADTDYRADGTLRLYLTSGDGDGEELLGVAREAEAVTGARLIADHDEGCLLEVTVEESLVAHLSEFGAVVRSVVAEQGTARLTVELPYEAEARELFALVEDRYPGTDLVGYHEHEREVGTRQEFRAALADRFTDRQETALRTAYLGGFFDWPRDVDGNELAEAMDISRPTYHQHLRAAQRKAFEELFE